MIDSEFKIESYFIEYHLDGKFIGHLIVDKPDRDIMGYQGRKQLTLENNIELTKSGKTKVYKKGLKLTSECIPLCGRLKKIIK